MEQLFIDPEAKPTVPFVKSPIWMDYGLRVKIHPTTFINRFCTILDTPVADVVIGARCNVGPQVTIVSVGHPLRAEERREEMTKQAASYGQSVVIGDGVWIGAEVTIL